jgi:hypothetical protein
MILGFLSWDYLAEHNDLHSHPFIANDIISFLCGYIMYHFIYIPHFLYLFVD